MAPLAPLGFPDLVVLRALTASLVNPGCKAQVEPPAGTAWLERMASQALPATPGFLVFLDLWVRPELLVLLALLLWSPRRPCLALVQQAPRCPPRPPRPRLLLARPS